MGGKGSSSPPPAPAPIDPGESMGEYLFGKGFSKYQGVTDPRLQNKLIAAEAKYRPQYTALELADINTMAYGTEGQAGLFDMLEDQSTRAGELQRDQLQLQRESDVGALQEFAPQVVEAYREADPYSTGLAEQQTAMAEDLYQRSQSLNPEQQRIADQQALGMSQRQGRISDQSAVAGQILGREQYLSGLRGEAAGMGQQAFNQNRILAGDVGNTILGRPSSAIGLGGQMLGAATTGASGPMGPQLFDPNRGINMALQQRSQDVNYQGAMAQADASRSAGKSSMFGSILGGFLGRPS